MDSIKHLLATIQSIPCVDTRTKQRARWLHANLDLGGFRSILDDLFGKGARR